MAQPTTTQHMPAPRQAATPGIGQMPGSVAQMGPMPEGAPPQTFDTPPADPVLHDQPDMVALLRLYPHAQSHEELRALAMAAGHAAKEAGLRLRAAQDEERDRPYEPPEERPPEPTPRREA